MKALLNVNEKRGNVLTINDVVQPGVGGRWAAETAAEQEGAGRLPLLTQEEEGQEGGSQGTRQGQ